VNGLTQYDETTKSRKHEPTGVVQSKEAGMRTRSHAIKTPDDKYRCTECNQIFDTLLAVDAHHFKEHERKPSAKYAGAPP
jgi:ribosomal protein L34E